MSVQVYISGYIFIYLYILNKKAAKAKQMEKMSIGKVVKLMVKRESFVGSLCV